MKKIIGILTLSVLFTINVNAQKQRQDNFRKKTKQTPERIAILQSKKMTLALDLDKKQQESVYKLILKNTEERTALRENFKSNKEKGAKLNDDEKFNLKNNRLDKQIARKIELKKILNDEQYKKWQKMSLIKNKNSKNKMRNNRIKPQQKTKRTQTRF